MGLFGGGNEQSGVERLREALEEPRETLDLHAVAAEPDLDENVVDTAVVPMDVFDSVSTESDSCDDESANVFDGETHYGTAALEFEIRDEVGEANFKDFCQFCGGLENIEGTRFDDVNFGLFGNINVHWSSRLSEDDNE